MMKTGIILVTVGRPQNREQRGYAGHDQQGPRNQEDGEHGR